jgi:hypothetical protein
MRGLVSARYAPRRELSESGCDNSNEESAISWISIQEKAIITNAKMHVEVANHTAKMRMIRT